MPAAARRSPASPSRRLVLLPREPRRAADPDAGPRRHRLARLGDTGAARGERFAHLKRSYD